ncbi:MAG: VCBS repeat-containing protein [Anaerolineales bacterium]|nr:VCBS repeat-containing protein [Anaerolineales bacterium]
MMKWGWLFVGAFLVLGLLVACTEGQEVAVESTAVITPLPTIEPTATETAVSVSVVEETAVPTLAPPTETPTTPSPLADVIDFHQLVEVPLDTSVAYSLKIPDYNFLRDWLRTARETPERGLPYFYVFDLLAFDFARSFPHGAGQLEPVFEAAQGGMYLDERLTWPVLETAVVAYLNQNRISLQDGNPIDILELTVNPQATDLNSDGILEWLLAVESKDLYILGAIPLSVDQSGVYTILPNMIAPINTSNTGVADGMAQMVFDFDFTGDGFVDILRVEQGYLGGPVAYIDVYMWNGYGFYRLETIDMSVPSFRPYASHEIGDFTDDGVVDIKVTTSHEVNFNCAWDEVDIYSWNGRTPQHLLMEETQMPDTPECAMFHAITPRNYYSEAVLAEKSRVELLESALGQLTLETAPSADYLALGYLHLAMAYLERNEVSKAQQTFDQLYNLPDTASFSQLVKELYAENDGNLLSVCQRLYTAPEQVEATGISDYIYEGSVTGFFGAGSALLNPVAICPYPQLITRRLMALSLPANQHPATSLSQLGYTFSLYNSFNLDLDASLEWLGIVQKEEAYLVLFDEVDGVLKPVILSNICLDCQDALIYELRLDEEGTYVVGRLSSYQVTCTLSYQLAVRNSPFLVRTTENGFDLDRIGTYCGGDADERPLTEISSADFAPDPPRPPTWRFLLHEATGQEDWEWLRDTQTAVLNQTDPTVPEKITQLLNYLPSDDPEAQPYIEHLTYLLGYFYELSGDGENAVSTYLDLIQQYPTSPWSWLAWARLELVTSE